jgi:hypothetical protein
MIIRNKLAFLPGVSHVRLLPLSYATGAKALRAVDPDTGEVYATLSVYSELAPLTDNQIFIKDYSENEGALTTLIDAGIISPITGQIPSGYVTLHLCTLTPLGQSLYYPKDPA